MQHPNQARRGKKVTRGLRRPRRQFEAGRSLRAAPWRSEARTRIEHFRASACFGRFPAFERWHCFMITWQFRTKRMKTLVRTASTLALAAFLAAAQNPNEDRDRGAYALVHGSRAHCDALWNAGGCRMPQSYGFEHVAAIAAVHRRRAGADPADIAERFADARRARLCERQPARAAAESAHLGLRHHRRSENARRGTLRRAGTSGPRSAQPPDGSHLRHYRRHSCVLYRAQGRPHAKPGRWRQHLRQR